MHKCVVVQRRIVFWALLVPLLGVLAVGDLQAQVEKATLSGVVFDVSGAVVVGTDIQAKNINTDIVYSAVTDGQGRYILPDMAVGTYEVSAEMAGFQKMVQTAIVLTVGARRVLDFTMEVGQPVDVIMVMGQASTVETETASLSTLIAPEQMELLPLNGRNFTDLLSLAATVATVPATGGGGGQSPTAYGQSTNYSVSGSRPVGMAYMLDNTDIRNQMDHGAGVSVMGTSLGMEAIQEFKILTNTYSAEFGGTGAAVNAVTKSGTNDLHGTVYEYFRNSVMDARNYFDVPGQKKPSFKRNNFGASIGGPIKKEKAFFFFNYEGLRASTGVTSRAVVPTSLPELFTAGGFTQDEESGQWIGEYGPINPVVESIFEMYPLAQSESQCPNVAGINFLPGTGLYCSNEKQIANEDYVLGRVDIKPRDRDSMFVRYARESAYQVLPYVYTQVPGWPEVDHERNQYLTINEQHLFSPTIINDVRFGYVRLFTETANGGINGTGTALQQVPGRQDMDFSPGWGLASLGPSPSSPSRPVMNRFSIGDTVFMALGSHSLRFGATLTRMQLNMLWNQYSGGAWIFANLGGGIFSFLGPEGGQLGGALYGAPLLGLTGAGDDYTYTTPDGESYPFNPARYWRQINFSPFIQDDWKITKRLTLNLGLRYEWASNPTTVGEPVFTINDLTSPLTTQDDFVAVKHPFNSNPNKGNFDPRIGIAWDVFGNHKTSIRAGFGTFHEPVTSRTYANNNTSYRPNQPLFFLFWTNSLFPNLPSDPHQTIYSPLTGPTVANHEIAWYYALPNTVDKAPYMMQYNVAVQQELAAGTVLTVAYNGSKGKNLFLWSNQNPPLAFSDQSAEWRADNAANWPDATGQGSRGTVANPFVGVYTNPNFKAVEGVTPTARSTYNGLQISLNRQFAKSLVFNVAYTYSKCRDNASATNSSEQGQWAVYNAYDPDFDWGPCSYSSDHVFTANALYRLPFEGNRMVDGWQVATIITRYTGLPFNLQNQFGGEYQSATGGATEGERPNVVPGCDPMTGEIDQWYNPECFVYAPYGTLGNSGRNSLNNPNFFNMDFSIVKDTKLNEKLNMQFRAEFFNVLNHPNFYFGSQAYLMGTAGVVTPTDPRYQYLSDPAAYRNPGGAICNGGQGPCYATSTGLNATMPGNQRQIQFAVKLLF
jgi:hypothetical protein